jgi:hypothetical protein
MTRYYFNFDGDAPYDYGTSRDETGSLLLLDHGAYERAPRNSPKPKNNFSGGERNSPRLPFSCLTRSGANGRSLAARAQ